MLRNNNYLILHSSILQLNIQEKLFYILLGVSKMGFLVTTNVVTKINRRVRQFMTDLHKT